MKLPSSHYQRLGPNGSRLVEMRLIDQRAFYHEMKTVGGVNGDAAFVTFDNALNCSRAIGLNFSDHRDEWDASLAPPPGDIFWSDKGIIRGQTAKRVVGSAMVVGIYACITSVRLAGTNLASALSLSPLQSVWDTYAPTLGLLIFLSFVPPVPILLSAYIFHFKCESMSRSKLRIGTSGSCSFSWS